MLFVGESSSFKEFLESKLLGNFDTFFLTFDGNFGGFIVFVQFFGTKYILQ